MIQDCTQTYAHIPAFGLMGLLHCMRKSEMIGFIDKGKVCDE
jgi:hypothetical protein